jgi:hypothetical protein
LLCDWYEFAGMTDASAAPTLPLRQMFDSAVKLEEARVH